MVHCFVPRFALARIVLASVKRSKRISYDNDDNENNRKKVKKLSNSAEVTSAVGKIHLANCILHLIRHARIIIVSYVLTIYANVSCFDTRSD